MRNFENSVGYLKLVGMTSVVVVVFYLIVNWVPTSVMYNDVLEELLALVWAALVIGGVVGGGLLVYEFFLRGKDEH